VVLQAAAVLAIEVQKPDDVAEGERLAFDGSNKTENFLFLA